MVDGKDPPVRLSSLLCLKTRYIFVGEYKDCAAPPEKMIKFGYSLVLEGKLLLRSLSYEMRLYLKFWLIKILKWNLDGCLNHRHESKLKGGPLFGLDQAKQIIFWLIEPEKLTILIGNKTLK